MRSPLDLSGITWSRLLAAVAFVVTSAVLPACGGGSSGGAETLPQGPPGTLDASFGTGGVVDAASGAPAPGAVAYGIAIQADGKFVAAGSSHQMQIGHGQVAAPSIARYNADGSLDISYGAGGIVSLAPGFPAYFTTLVVQADGHIVAAGYGFGGNSCFVQRFASNGATDTTFGGVDAGVVHLGRWCNALALQPDGRTLIGGYAVITAEGFPTFRYRLQRLNADGSRDTTFGDGAAEVLVSSDPYIFPALTALAVDATGAIIASGKAEAYDGNGARTASVITLLRFDSSGRLDDAFASGGAVAISTGAGSFDVSSGVALQPDGKIVIAGSSGSLYYPSSSDPQRLTLVRVLPNGALDTSFGASGIVASKFGAVYSVATAIALQSNGKFVVVGSMNEDASTYTSKILVARYASNGTVDGGFGANGLAETASTGGRAQAVAIRRDGRIYVAGTSSSDLARQNYWIAAYFGDPVTSKAP